VFYAGLSAACSLRSFFSPILRFAQGGALKPKDGLNGPPSLGECEIACIAKIPFRISG
jgi:hypothetical protein